MSHRDDDTATEAEIRSAWERFRSDVPCSQLAALVRLFPVLRRVPSIHDVDEQADDARDADERRRRAITALRSLLCCVAPATPLIIHVDDAQWADADGAQLLASVLEASRPLLLVLSDRDDAQNPSLAGLFRALERSTQKFYDVALGGLPPAQLAALCREALARLPAGAVDVLVREAEGSPYFALELMRASDALGETARLAAVGGITTTPAPKRAPAFGGSSAGLLGCSAKPRARALRSRGLRDRARCESARAGAHSLTAPCTRVGARESGAWGVARATSRRDRLPIRARR
jgi:hypothetical protein